jgi:cell division septation protein DedD
MDESLKARLIGATVLVIVAVLLIPELLSGRKARDPVVEGTQSVPGTRTFTIELGPAGSDGPQPSPARSAAARVSASRQPPEAESPRSDTTGTAGAPAIEPAETIAGTTPAPGTDSGAVAATTTTVPSQPAAISAATADDGWAVQVGAFGSAESASRVVRDLEDAGFEARVAPVTRAGKTLHRVRVGHASDKPAAERLAQQLQSRGLPSTVVEDD